ncbi:hypothetical protein Ddc_07324 [Ditylenchus destructor]|nr:hypothetical protein Ddc_07324 [Ditylenchus destructor]
MRCASGRAVLKNVIRPAGYSHFYLLDTAIQELRVQCVADIFSSFFFAGGSRPFLVERPLKASNFQPPHHSHSRAYSMHLCLAVAREFQKWNCIVPGISSPSFLNNFPTDHSEADLGVTIRSSNAETVDILLSPSLFLMLFNNCIVLLIKNHASQQSGITPRLIYLYCYLPYCFLFPVQKYLPSRPSFCFAERD